MIQFKLSDLEQCWLHGFKSFHQNVDETANPYTANTKQAHYWREGWWEACFNIHNLSDVYKNHYNTTNINRFAS